MTPVGRLFARLVSLSLLFSLAACSAQSENSPTECEPNLSYETGKSQVTLRMGGTDREFLLFVPSGYDGFQPHALMLIFHVWSMAPSL